MPGFASCDGTELAYHVPVTGRRWCACPAVPGERGGASHFPWVDDPAAFAAAIGAFLGGG